MRAKPSNVCFTVSLTKSGQSAPPTNPSQTNQPDKSPTTTILHRAPDAAMIRA
jgi:hypothetical protein